MRDERRNFARRCEAQCRLLAWLCNRRDGASLEEAAEAAQIPPSGARRVLKRLAAKYLVHCEHGSRWKPDTVLLTPPALRIVEP